MCHLLADGSIKFMHFWEVGIREGMGKGIAEPAENPTRFENAYKNEKAIARKWKTIIELQK